VVQIKIKVNLDKLQAANRKTKRRVRKFVRAAVREGARDIRDEARRLIKSSPKGYRRYYYPGVGWTASSYPGAAPANQTGTLMASIQSRIKAKGIMSAEIGPSAHYGGYLEQGTSKMAARPYMKPALEAKRSAYVERVRDAVARGFA